MGKLTAEFESWYAHVREDPLVFAREALMCIDDDETGPNNPRLTDQQAQLLLAVKKDMALPMDERKKRVAVKSGQGTGKTTDEVILALWRVFLAVDNLVMVTAPTAVQVRDVWFAELGRILQNAHPFIRKACKVTAMKCIIFGHVKTWGIWGRTATKAENFQGYHATQLTFILDEASGIDRESTKGSGPCALRYAVDVEGRLVVGVVTYNCDVVPCVISQRCDGPVSRSAGRKKK